VTTLLVLLAALAPSAASAFPSDGEIKAILRARVDTLEQSVGIVVGVIDSTGSRFVSYGTTYRDGVAAVDGRTLLEIGSISKVFTSLLLADMVLKEEVSLRDPVADYLPADVDLPRMGDRHITLEDLATHRSGLPRMPDVALSLSLETQTPEFSEQQLYDFLSRCTLVHDIGSQYMYSNLGVGLLGQALANRAGKDLEELLMERVCKPLGLPDTRFSLSAEQESRQAGAHDWIHNPTPQLQFGALKGAGSLKSTAADLLSFVAANAGLVEVSESLWPAMHVTHLSRQNTPFGKVRVALGWHTFTLHGREIVWHNGATLGNVAFAGFDREAGKAVVVLSNARGIIDDIGIHLLDPEYGIASLDEKDTRPQPTAPVAIEQLRPLVGEYSIGPNLVIVLTIEDDKLYLDLDGFKLEMAALSEREIYNDLMPHVFKFEMDEEGLVDEVSMNFFGRSIKGLPLEHYRSRPIRVAEASDDDGLRSLVGTYALVVDGDSLLVKVTHDPGLGVIGDLGATGGLSVQADEQLTMPLIETTAGFYAREADAELVFERDDSGLVTGLIIHQDGEHRAAKLGDAQ